MDQVAEDYLLLPILNRRPSFLKIPVLELSDNAYVRTIADDHFGAIFDKAPEPYRHSLQPNTKCLYVKIGPGDDPERNLGFANVAVRFTMNFFCSKGPLLFAFGIHAQKKKKLKVLKSFFIPVGTDRQDLAKIGYELRAGVKPDEVRAHFEVVSNAIKKSHTILLALGRINSFLTKTDLEDRIIDLTIGLESLIPGKDELRYRFSLYLSFITEKEPVKRLEKFKLFQALYDTRSRIVHGGDFDNQAAKKQKMLTANWDELIRISLSAVNYHLYFLSANEVAKWSEHLQSLVIEGAPRAVD